jgi:endonuclease/exonuclease/phosphatase family metal-dependent hydrolase
MVYRTATPPVDSTRLRVITLNLWGIEPPLEKRLKLTADQLLRLQPDVVCLQEVRPVRDFHSTTTADLLAETLSMQSIYAEHTNWGDKQEGLAIMSRLPIVSTQFEQLPARLGEGRILQSAAIQTAHGNIFIHNTHLNYRLDDGYAREEQVLQIDQMIRSRRNNESPPQILCGDFNATADSDEIRFLRGLTTLRGTRTHFQDAWLRLHREPQPGDGPAQGITWSSENEHTRALRSLDIDRRIDYVFVTSRKRDGRGTVHRCEVVMTASEGEGGEQIHASDHYGVLAEIQIAPSEAAA